MALLEIKDLHVRVEDKEILKGVTLTIDTGKITALMGPNGSGKSTLASTIMGHPKFHITSGSILFNGEDITDMAPDERARKGVFLSFQYPSEIQGVTISNFLRTAINARRDENDKIKIPEFKRLLDEKQKLLQIDNRFMFRYLNDGFSGGEKKRAEILQLLTLNPKLAILDETDSGLDIDSLRIVSEGVNHYKNEHNAVLIITHYKRILEYIKPDHVVIIIDGKIALEGTGQLVDQLEEKGYGWISES